MALRPFHSRIAIALLAVALTVCCPIFGQEDSSDADSEKVLNEIRLDNEGVTAVDTTGHAYRYDFVEGKFVPDEDTDGEAGGPDRTENGEIDFIPVEERCSRELKVDAWENTVRVENDQFVDGDIVAYGRVTVKGWVRGNVKSLSNRVLITSTGVVDGDVVAPDVVVKSGAVVHGEVTRTGNPLDLDDLTGSFTVDGIIVVASITIFMLLCAFLVAALMPRQMLTLQTCMREYPARSFLLGFLLTLFVPLVAVLVFITIVGILLVPLIPIAYLAGFILGIIAFGAKVASKILTRFNLGGKDLIPQSLIGTLMLMLFWFLVALFLGMSDPTAQGFGIFLLVLAIIITVYPMAMGIGAVVLTRFGFRPYASGTQRQRPHATPSDIPAPPPIPDGPPSPTPPGDRSL